MKKATSILLALCCTAAVLAQTPETKAPKAKAETPEVVKKAFDKKFAGATDVKWGMEKAKIWEAEFKLKGEELSANFTNDGYWIETEKEIKTADLPKAVMAAIKAKYDGWEISAAAQTITPKNGTIYEAQIKRGKDKKEVAFDEGGKPVTE